MSLHRALLVLTCVSLSTTLRILSGRLKCSQQELNCEVRETNCLDKRWLKVHDYTPSSPEDLQVSVDVRPDEAGLLQPVLEASWKLKDDGSIHFLNATELHVLVESTNQNLCVRYSFNKELPMRSPSGEKWSFSADMLVLDPGQSYQVSVFNIPKPELHHSSYDIRKKVTVPGCKDPNMTNTQFCIERGSLWQPNISLSQVTLADGKPALAVNFSPDNLCENYKVIVRCSSYQNSYNLNKANQTLKVTVSLDTWPRSCCQFDVEIKPYFSKCGEDCTRPRKTHNICPNVTKGPAAFPADNAPDYKLVSLGVVSMCILTAAVTFAICRKPGKTNVSAGPKGVQEVQPVKQKPKVLVIYSQDHHLYRDIVLKLCTFLQTKCGTKVLVDLLDSTSVGMVGRLRWLEWQRQQLKDPSDKILVLCSRGVQAKWKAMCGQGRVTLKEDLLSPTDDMLTPFLNLFLPEMHQAGMLGKYMVAYFDDISSEKDVPSVFDIAVKYSLMKHFEELFFRILDIEKYQPGQVKHIEGIGADEYFNCPSGKALRTAIETFQAYQFENPDWFEKQCVVSEEEVLIDANMLIEQLHIPPVLECVPLIRDEFPVYVHDVEINENSNSIHILTPELNPESQLSSVIELIPAVNPIDRHQHSSGLENVLTESIYVAEPVLNNPPAPRHNWISLVDEPFSQIPTEDNEEDSFISLNQASAYLDHRSQAPPNSLDFNSPESSCTSVPRQRFPPSEMDNSEHVPIEENEALEPKGPSSGSDQGYSSKNSSQHESLVALAKLQKELFEENLRCSEGNDFE
ncbi:interleukin 17 receptor A1a [Oreochromis aureus]|uniref:SEFIR domain-containing protein n=1 Tax=Oreochromis aureus TaxID=47969 RepID=A0A668TQF1_OREAU|nr:interleukin 17 receptor A1a [Oreochromis aureus]